MTGGADVPPIDLAIDVPVPPAEAWRAITDPARIADWFTDASALGAVGSPYRLDFGEGSIVGGTVVAVDPGRSFSYTWHWDGTDDRETTQVTLTVEPGLAGASRIHLVHDGWADADLDAGARDDHEGYWSGYLDDLLGILEEA